MPWHPGQHGHLRGRQRANVRPRIYALHVRRPRRGSRSGPGRHLRRRLHRTQGRQQQRLDRFSRHIQRSRRPDQDWNRHPHPQRDQHLHRRDPRQRRDTVPGQAGRTLQRQPRQLDRIQHRREQRHDPRPQRRRHRRVYQQRLGRAPAIGHRWHRLRKRLDRHGIDTTNAGGTFTYNTAITNTNFDGNTRSLSKLGTGTLVLGANSTYIGTTTIASSGTLQIGSGGTTGSLGTGAVANAGTLTFNRSNAMTVANTISGAGTVNQIGTGTTILSAANTFTGQTTISGRALQLSNALSIQSTTVTVSANNGLAFTQGFSPFTIGGLAGTGNDVLVDNTGAAISLKIGNNNAANTYSGNLSGDLTKLGTGTQILSGTNTYTGGADHHRRRPAVQLRRRNRRHRRERHHRHGRRGVLQLRRGPGNAQPHRPRFDRHRRLGRLNWQRPRFQHKQRERANVSLGSDTTATYSGTLTPFGNTFRLGGAGRADHSSALTGAGNGLVINGSQPVTGNNVILSGATANTFGGTTIVNNVGSSNYYALVLNKTAGVNAIGGNLQIGNSGTGYATVSLGNSNQIPRHLDHHVLGFHRELRLLQDDGQQRNARGHFRHNDGRCDRKHRRRGDDRRFDPDTQHPRRCQLQLQRLHAQHLDRDWWETAPCDQDRRRHADAQRRNIIYTGTTLISSGTLKLVSTTAFNSNITDNANLSVDGIFTLSKVVSGSGTLTKIGAGPDGRRATCGVGSG